MAVDMIADRTQVQIRQSTMKTVRSIERAHPDQARGYVVSLLSVFLDRYIDTRANAHEATSGRDALQTQRGIIRGIWDTIEATMPDCSIALPQTQIAALNTICDTGKSSVSVEAEL
jgi:hypothetical protein